LSYRLALGPLLGCCSLRYRMVAQATAPEA